MTAWFAAIWTALYHYHYGVGLHTVRLVRRIYRLLYRISQPLRRLFMYFWVRRVALPIHRIHRKLRNIGGRMKPAFRLMKRTAKEKNIWAVVPCFWGLCRSAVRHYWDELASLGRILGPVMAVLVLTTTIGVWTGAEYYLSVQYGKTTIGVVASAEVYAEGAAMARERVINDTNDFEVMVPVFTITMQGRQTPMTPEQVCDAILRESGDEIAEATGLYINKKFVGAMESAEELNALLDSIKKADKNHNADDKTQKVSFVQTVKMTDGLYPVSALRDAATMREQLNKKEFYTVVAGDTLETIAEAHDLTVEELSAMNPIYSQDKIAAALNENPALTVSDILKPGVELTVSEQKVLTVKVVRTEKAEETIPYKSKTVRRNDKFDDYKKVTTEGKNGVRELTYEVTLIGDEETRKVVDRKVIKKAVTEVVERGTKKRVTMNGMEVEWGDGVVHGNMLWPVPICHSMSRGFFPGHYAIDICNGPVKVYGHPAVAADGGTVVYAGWYYDYGYYVKIRHSNGLETSYAHLSAIKVTKGQKVSRGQTVGLIGSTGNSSGPHLHFEVIKNGVRVNPLLYVKP